MEPSVQSPEECILWVIRVLQGRLEFFKRLDRPLTTREQSHLDALGTALTHIEAASEALTKGMSTGSNQPSRN